MNHFVQGVLTVEDEAYLSEPDIRLATGEKIRILYASLRHRANQEDDGSLSLLLEANQWYELLLIVQVGLGREQKITYSPSVPSETRFALVSTEISVFSEVVRRTNVVQGIILDLDWDAASQHYLAIAGPLVHTHHFVLIETAIGNMVLSYAALQKRLGEEVKQLTPGGYLEWEPARLDLLAILAKRKPQPGE